MTNIFVYHASPIALTAFRPCAHFGTEQAAKDRLKGQPGFMHKCVLKDTTEIISVGDWGSNKPEALCGLLHDRYEESDPMEAGFFDGARQLMLSAKIDKAASNVFLEGVLRVRGISVVQYVNECEDPGSISYFVLDGALVSVVESWPA